MSAKSLYVVVFAWALVLPNPSAWASIVGTNTALLWDLAAKLKNSGSSARSLSREELGFVTAAAGSDNPMNRSAAACVLGLAANKETSTVLARLVKDTSEDVRGAAQLGELLRDCAGCTAEQRLVRLSLELGRSGNCMFKFLVVNLLGTDYGQAAAPTLAAMLDGEKDRSVRYEILYQLVHSGVDSAVSVAERTLKSEPNWQLFGHLAYAAGSLSSGRSKSSQDNNTGELLYFLRSARGSGGPR